MLPTSGGSVSLAAQPHENAKTLARLFRAAGLRTGMFTNQPLLKARGFTRGFEGIQIADLENGQVSQTAANVTNNALQFIDDFSRDPFMVFTHFVERHAPYSLPPETGSAFGVD
jgi:hypothetical protein